MATIPGVSAEMKGEANKARQSDAVLNLILATCHEINQPLNAISIMLDSLFLTLEKAENVQSAPLREQLTNVQEQIELITTIVGSMNFLTLHETNTQFEPIDANIIVDTVLELSGRFQEHARVTIATELAPGPLLCRIHPHALEMVLHNLIRNAAEAILMNADHDPSGNGFPSVLITTAVEQSGLQKNILISVVDRGGGIEPEHISRVFEPFYTTKQTSRNAGIGLTVSRAIIDNYHGSLELESDKRGTRVMVRIPFCSQPNRTRKSQDHE